MKVDLVSYVDPRRASGGGELAIQELLREGRVRGHRVEHTHCFPDPVFSRHRRPDVAVLADLFNLPGHWGRLDRRLRSKLKGSSPLARYRARVEHAISSLPFIHHDNAYVDVCRRPYLPCNGDDARAGCCRKGGRASWVTDWDELYRRSRANSFVSPLHADTIEGVLGGDLPPRIIMRPTIDPGRFYDQRLTRDIPRLYVGPLHEAKGLREMRCLFSDDEIWTLTPNPGPLLRRVRARSVRFAHLGRPLGRVPHESMPELYSRAEELVLIPRWPEPMGRVVVEAALCGCRLRTNGRVGALTFSMHPSDPELCRGAGAEWWQAVERVAGCA